VRYLARSGEDRLRSIGIGVDAILIEDEAVLLGHPNEFGVDVALRDTRFNKPVGRIHIGRLPERPELQGRPVSVDGGILASAPVFALTVVVDAVVSAGRSAKREPVNGFALDVLDVRAWTCDLVTLPLPE